MTPSVDTLSRLLNDHSTAMVTLVGADGHLRTRPMTPLKARFKGHLWFKLEADVALAADVGRGTEVSVAYGTADAAPCVTVYGWALLLRDSASANALWNAIADARPMTDASLELLCVAARAAEIWDPGSHASSRIFAFPGAHEASDPMISPHQETAFRLHLVAEPAISGCGRSGQRRSASALTGK